MSDAPRFCPHCGADQQSVATEFCTSCGKRKTPGTPQVAPAATPAATPAQVPPKRRSPIGYIVITLLFLVGCYWLLIAPAMRINEQAKTYTVVYRISGSARSVDLTYQNASASSEQARSKPVPWNMTFSAHPGEFLYVSAQNNDASGTVKCELLVNGTVVKSAESNGAYTIATCNVRL